MTEGGGEALGSTSIVQELVVRAREEVVEVMERVIEAIDRVRDASLSATERLSAMHETVGIVSGAVLSGVGALLTWGAQSAIAFQEATDALETFGHASEEQMALYSKGLIEISNDTGRSTEELAKQLLSLHDAGFQGAQGLAVLRTATEGAVAAHIALGESVTPLIQIMREWNISGQESEKVMDTMLVGARDLGGDATRGFSYLNLVMSRSGPIARDMGMSYQSVIATFDAFSEKGTRMHYGIRDTNALLMGMKSALTETNPGLKTLGISFDDLQVAAKQGIAPALELINKHMKDSKLSSGIAAEGLRELLGSGAAVTAFSHLQRDNFREIAKAQADMAKSSDTTKESFGAAMKSVGAEAGQTKTLLHNFATELGIALLPALSAMAQGINHLLQPMVMFAQAHQQLMLVVLGTVAAIASFSLAISGTMSIARPFFDLFETSQGAIKSMAEALDGVGGGEEELKQKTEGTTAARIAATGAEERLSAARLASVGATKEAAGAEAERAATTGNLAQTIMATLPASQAQVTLMGQQVQGETGLVEAMKRRISIAGNGVAIEGQRAAAITASNQATANAVTKEGERARTLGDTVTALSATIPVQKAAAEAEDQGATAVTRRLTIIKGAAPIEAQRAVTTGLVTTSLKAQVPAVEAATAATVEQEVAERSLAASLYLVLVAMSDKIRKLLLMGAATAKEAVEDMVNQARRAGAWLASTTVIIRCMEQQEKGLAVQMAVALKYFAEEAAGLVKSAALWVATSAKKVAVMIYENVVKAATAVITILVKVAEDALKASREQGTAAAGVLVVQEAIGTGVRLALAAATGLLTLAMRGLSAAIIESPLGPLALALILISVVVFLVVTHMGLLIDVVKNISAFIAEKALGIFNMLHDAIMFVVNILVDVVKWVGHLLSYLPGLTDSVKMTTSAVNDFSGALKSVAGFLGGIFNATLGHAGHSIDEYAHEHDKLNKTVENGTRIFGQHGGELMTYATMDASAVQMMVQNHNKLIGSYDDLAQHGKIALDKLSADMELQATVKFKVDGGPQQQQLQTAIQQLPSNLQDVMQPVFAQFQHDLNKEHTDFVSKMRSMYNDHQAALQKLQDKRANDEAKGGKTAADAADNFRKGLISLNEGWLKHIADQKQTYEEHVKGIREAMAKVATPAGLWDAMKQSADNLAKDHLAALSLALVKGKGNIDGLTQSAANSIKSVDQLAAAETRAAIAADKAAGDWGDAVTKQTQTLKTAVDNAIGKFAFDKKAPGVDDATREKDRQQIVAAQEALSRWQNQVDAGTNIAKKTGDQIKALGSSGVTTKSAMDALSQAMMTGHGNITKLTEAAIRAQQKQDELTAAQTRAKVVVDEATGHFKDALSTLTSTLQNKLDDAMAKEALDLLHHSGNVRADAAEVAGLQKRMNDYSKTQDTVKNQAAGVSKAFSDLQQAAGTTLQTGLDRLAAAIYSGHGNIVKLTKAADDAQEKVNKMAKAMADAQARIDKTDVVKSMNDVKTTLDTGLQKSLAQMSHDLYYHTGNVKNDAAAIDRAQRAMDRYTNSIDKSQRVADAAKSVTFSDVTQTRQSAVDKALSNLELALLHHTGNYAALTKAVADAQKNRQALTKVEEDAALRVAKATGDYTAVLAGLKNTVDTAVTKSFSALEVAVITGKGNLDKLAEAAAKAEAAQRKQAAKIDEATLLRARAEGDWSTVLSVIGKQLDQKLGDATSHLVDNLYRHNGNIEKDTAAIYKAEVARAKLTLAEEQASQIELEQARRAALAVGDLARAADLTKQEIDNRLQDALKSLTLQLYNGASAAQVSTTALNQAAADSYRWSVAEKQANELLTAGMLRAALAAGNLAMAADLTKQQIDQHMTDAVKRITMALYDGASAAKISTGDLNQAAADAYRWSVAEKQANELVTAATIRAARAAGDLGVAFEQSKSLADTRLNEAISKAAGELLDYGAISQQTADELQANAIAVAVFDRAIQQATASAQIASGVWSQLGQGLGTQLNQAMDDVAQKIYDLSHGISDTLPPLDNLIQTAQGAQDAQRAYTQAQWDAAFATADAATQTQMLSQRFQHLISEAQSAQQQESTLNNAQQAIIAANSALQVEQMKANTQAITDMTAVLQQQGEITKLQGEGQVTAIGDQTDILKAEWGIAHATDAGSLLTAQDALAEARIKDAADRAANAWQIRIAQENLRIAQFKMTSDTMLANLQIGLARDAVSRAQDEYLLAVAQAKLAADQLVVLNDIDSNLAAVNDYGDMIRSDLSDIAAIQQQVGQDIQSQGQDQMAQAAAQAAQQQQQALMQQQLQQDQVASNQSQTNYQIQAAQASQKTALDSLRVQQQTAANTTTANTLLQQQLNAALQEMSMMNQAQYITRLGLSRWVVGMGNERTWLNSLGTSNYANVTATA